MTQGKKIDEDDLINELQRLNDKLDRTPGANDMKAYGKYSFPTYMNRFGSWNDAVEQAGLEPREQNATISAEELLRDLRRVADSVETVDGYLSGDKYDEHGKYSSPTYVRRFDGWVEALEAAGLPSEMRRDRDKDISDKELIEELQRLADELGETPSYNAMTEHGQYSGGVYLARFDTWNDAVREAGLDPNPAPH